jgi:hypothetical protein
MAATPKITDSAPESAKPEAAKPPETTHNLLDLMEKNALAPVVNSLGVGNVNTGANMLNEALALGTSAVNAVAKTDLQAYQVGKLHDMEVGKVEKGSIGYYSQQILGTGASFVGYAIAGKVAGKFLRTVGEAAPIGMTIGEINVGSGIRAAAQDARVANVIGATAYAGFKDTKDGESHLSNAVSTFASFSMFEAGNSAINPASSILLKIGQRAVVGYAGGAVQANVASRIQTGKWADSTEINAAGLSGAALNALLPGGRQAIDHGLELTGRLPHTTEATARLHEEAVKALPEGQSPEPGSWADRNAIKSLNKAARADLNTRVKLNDDGQTRIDQKKNVVSHQTGDDPLNVLQELAHRRIYNEPVYEQAFKSLAKEIKSPNPADPKNAAAREGYVNTRLDQEVAARTAQNQEAEKLGATRRVSVDRNDILTKEGYKDHFESEADAFIRSGGKERPIIDYSGGKDAHESSEHESSEHDSDDHDAEHQSLRAALEHEYDSADPLDRPPVLGKDAIEVSGEYPNGRKLQYFTYPGLKINGHDNVIFEARYDHNLDEVILVKQHPETGERSAVRLRNDDGGTIAMPSDGPKEGSGETLTAKSVERFYFKHDQNLPANQLFDSDHRLRAISYEVTEGSKLVPDNTTYTQYKSPERYQIGSVDIQPSASVTYPDGRIDWHQHEPFPNLITEWPKIQQIGNLRYKFSVPQTMDGSHRVFVMDENDKATDTMVDIFAKSNPLETSFGKALRVDRSPDDTVYHLTDGSSVRIFYHEGEMYQARLAAGAEEPEIKVFGPDEGYSEKYSTPWESVFGLAKDVKVTPTETMYRLANGDVAKNYSKPSSFKGIENVEWSYQRRKGDTTIQLADDDKTRVWLPKNGIETEVAGIRAAGLAQLGPNAGYTRYYLANGDPMDILPTEPVDGVRGVQGVVRKPGELTYVSGTANNWKQVTIHFANGALPVIEVKTPGNEPEYINQTAEHSFDENNRMFAIISESYPNGVQTKWGVAVKRGIYWTGEGSLTMRDGKVIKLDAAGNQIEHFQNDQ